MKKLSLYDYHEQCDQIGRFLKLLPPKFLSKEAQNDWQLLDNFDKVPLMLKLLGQLFGQLLENFGLLFNLTSGHTDHEWLKWAMPDCKTYFCRKVNFFTMTMTPIIKMTNFFIFEFPVQLKNWNLNIWIFIIQIKVF